MYRYISIASMVNDIRTTKNLIELAKDNQESAPILFLGLLPYLALEVEATYDLLNSIGIDLNHLPMAENYQNILKKVRTKAKLYKEKTRKNIENIKKIRNDQNKVYSKGLEVDFLEFLGWFGDYGTYKYQESYMGNSFLYIWYFDSIENISSSTDISKKYGMMIQNLSKAMSQFVLTIESCFSKIPEYEKYPLKGKIPVVTLADFDISRKNTLLFKNGIDKDCSLFLFNLLCAVNFVEFYMKEILEQKNSFYIRMKYLIYYFVVSSLESLVRFSEQNKIFCTGVNQYLNEIGNMKSLRNEKFCSCMRHYGITEADLPNNYIQSKRTSCRVNTSTLQNRFTGIY